MRLRSEPVPSTPSRRGPSRAAGSSSSEPAIALPPDLADEPRLLGLFDRDPARRYLVVGARPGVSGARSGDRVAAYGLLADAYDIVHREKPYAAEARRVRAAAQRWATIRCRSLLDVACGSGRHLAEFVRWYDCTGLDASRSMLARARRRLPRVRWVRGRMEAFDLGREFDIVCCLFSAVGYVRSPAGLRQTIAALARHTSPGGVVVVEPWLTPEVFREGRVHHLVARSEGTTVLRMNGARRVRGRSVFDFHYLVGRDGAVRHAVERHDLGLFSRTQMEAAFRAAGLTPHFDPKGFATRRGLYVAVRPGVRAERRAAGRRRRRRRAA